MTLPAPLRVMFDSNAYDEILRHNDADRIRSLIEAEKLAVVTTHVQGDELRQIADAQKRAALLDSYNIIGGKTVLPAEAIDGDITYMSRDDMLAGVAKACCDRLVTHDRVLAERCSDLAISYGAFRQLAGLDLQTGP
ncbi:MAG: hypothetical protein ACK4FJ_11370 [Ferrovibrio sp.]|uniref:hypothetical protein n=1 Tax=Ferrovibrio sp. TaxID=1917215 RepID=UPI00391DFB55